jgi:hypothetical protein
MENQMSLGRPNLRPLARDALARARVELASGEEHRLRYAALELRLAMEALTYDRAAAFAELIPPEEYKTWQPRKLMAVLLEIDPAIGMTSTISIGRQPDEIGDEVFFSPDNARGRLHPMWRAWWNRSGADPGR